MIDLRFDYLVRLRTGHYSKDNPSRREMEFDMKLSYDRPLQENEVIETWIHDQLPRSYKITKIIHRLQQSPDKNDQIRRVEEPLVFADAVGFREPGCKSVEFDKHRK